MQTTQKVKTTVKGQASEKRSHKAKPKSEAQKMIPPKKGRGRRTAAEEKLIEWLVAATESFSAGPMEEWKKIPPVICLPCLDIKDIKSGEKIERALEITVPVIPAPSQNGVVHDIPVLKSPESKPAPEPTTDESNLDKDLTTWMKAAFNKYIVLAGQKPSFGREWGLRMAQVAIGFDVMSDGKEWTKEVFPHFIGALFELLDEAKSTKDLDLLEYILKGSVYLDVLAEAAEFHTKNGVVSVNFQNYYEDKYLTFVAADDLIRGRGRL